MRKEGEGYTLRNGFLLIVILIIAALLYYLGFFNQPCNNDECFDNALRVCKPIDFVRHVNNSVYLYTIYRSPGQDCFMEVSLKSVAPGSDIDIKELLEGKSMRCKIPKTLLESRPLDELDNMLEYCHGELKEGIYELIIKRMYGLVIGNLNAVLNVAKGSIQ